MDRDKTIKEILWAAVFLSEKREGEAKAMLEGLTDEQLEGVWRIVEAVEDRCRGELQEALEHYD